MIAQQYDGVTAFELLADPTRRRVLDELRRGECSVGQLVDRLGMKQPTVSKQLKVLRDAGLATVRVDAKRRLYRLDTTPLRALDDWLEPYRKLWSDRLDALEDHLTRMDD
jgi:DNA-binding transcriptional ArsR family regulator